jgi:hypothetical protein
MSERKTCVKCGRAIDAVARICPFCNWDQNEPLPAYKAAPAIGALPEYVPPEDRAWRKPIFGMIGGVLGIIVAFVIGVHVHGNKPPVAPPGHSAPITSAASSSEAQRPHANVTLVPDNSAMPSIEQPITSAPVTQPAQGVPSELQRTDATAVSSDEYAQMAQRAKAEKKKMAVLVDPRSITGVAYQTVANPLPVRRVERPAVAQTTNPIPESQPLPQIRVPAYAVARVVLLVGPDGRVHDVDVRQGLGRDTAALVAAVQQWRFRPATLNGSPVASAFSVELSFKPDE